MTVLALTALSANASLWMYVEAVECEHYLTGEVIREMLLSILISDRWQQERPALPANAAVVVGPIRRGSLHMSDTFQHHQPPTSSRIIPS